MNLLLKHPGWSSCPFTPDPEALEYAGGWITVGKHTFIFRKAKITPKKTGQFVSLWCRDKKSGSTKPFHESEIFQGVIIYVADPSQDGLFLFSKKTLIDQKIISDISGQSPGKRGFRLYPPWDTPTNCQARKSQAWQLQSSHSKTTFEALASNLNR